MAVTSTDNSCSTTVASCATDALSAQYAYDFQPTPATSAAIVSSSFPTVLPLTAEDHALATFQSPCVPSSVLPFDVPSSTYPGLVSSSVIAEEEPLLDVSGLSPSSSIDTRVTLHPEYQSSLTPSNVSTSSSTGDIKMPLQSGFSSSLIPSDISSGDVLSTLPSVDQQLFSQSKP